MENLDGRGDKPPLSTHRKIGTSNTAYLRLEIFRSVEDVYAMPNESIHAVRLSVLPERASLELFSI